MAVNKGPAAAWAVALGLLAGSIAGTTVPARTPGQELQHVAGFTILFIPVVYAMIEYRTRLWQQKPTSVKFTLFMLSALVFIVISVKIAIVLFGGSGGFSRVAEFVAALVGFAVTVWVTFLGGAERIWAEFIDRMDINW